jgi:ribosomal protein S1
MSESFAQLFEESLKELDMNPGSIVKGTIVSDTMVPLTTTGSLSMRV